MQMEKSLAPSMEIHVVLDICAAHKHPETKGRLDERFSSELTSRQLKRRAVLNGADLRLRAASTGP
jgi:hypothetical protein